MAELVWVLLEVALQLGAVEELMADFQGAGVTDGERGDGAEGVGDAVAEGIEVGGVESEWFEFVALAGLVLGNLSEDGFVMLGRGEGRCFVFAVEVGRDDEGEGDAGLAGPCGSADAVGV